MKSVSSSRYAAHDRKIPDVINIETGTLLTLDEFLGNSFPEIEIKRMTLREDIAREAPKWLCPLCLEPVYLVCLQTHRRFHFKHLPGNEECADTRGDKGEDRINALKYNGAKESLAHRRMKEIVAESVRADSRFSNPDIERVWKGIDRKAWRKPDVQSVFDGQRIAFEIQLSTTFLRVIAERRVFYLQEGGLLLWIFKSYDEEKSRLTQDDLFYNNNRNLFIVSEDTLRISKEQRRFAFECRWIEPKATASGIETSWNGKIVYFDELTQDIPRQRIFYFDYEAAEVREKAKFQEQPLRERVERFWIDFGHDSHDRKEWLSVREALASRNVVVPEWPDDSGGPWRLLDILYSAKVGRPVGLGHRKLIDVAHYVEDKQKGFLWLFRKALLAYGRQQQIIDEDETGNWREKVRRYKACIKAGDDTYAPDQRFNKLVEYLFPEVWEQAI